MLERICGDCPAIRTETFPVGCRPRDQHIRLGRRSFDRLASWRAGSGRSRRSGLASSCCRARWRCVQSRWPRRCCSPGFRPLTTNWVSAASPPRSKTARLIPFGPSTGGPTPAAKACLWVAELLAWTLAGGVFALAARESRRDGVRALSRGGRAGHLSEPGRRGDADS